MRRMGWLLAGVLLLWAGLAFARVPEVPRFRAIGVADGLPATGINAIVRDHAGYIWIATADGLARYDGVGFKVWRNEPGNSQSLPGNTVQALHVDARDRIWIATESGGLSMLDAQRRGFTHYRMAEHPEIGSDDTWAIASKGDVVWFGTYAGGVHRLAIFGMGEGRLTVRADVAVHKIGPGVRPHALEERVRAIDFQSGPAHVRHRHFGPGLQAADDARDEAEHRHAGSLLAGVEQKLLTEADAEKGAAEGADRLDQTEVRQPLHGEAGGADPGQDQAFRSGDRIRIGRQVDGRAESFEREPDGGDIPCAVRDNGDLAHKTPLVLGTVSPSMRMACRRARPKAL